MTSISKMLLGLCLLESGHSVVAVNDAQAQIISLALRSIGGRRIKIILPSDWSIGKKDEAAQWLTSSYSFTVAKHGAVATNPPVIEILQHAIGRAERHGDLDGRKFTTLHGVSGIEHDVSWEAGSHDWYLAIRPKNEDTEDVVIVRIIFHNTDLRYQRTFAQFVYAHLKLSREARPPHCRRRRD